MGAIRVTRFGGRFAPSPAKHRDLKSLIEQCDDLYPGIDVWYKRKIISGLKDRERTAYIICEESQPVGAAILKLGANAKICSFRIFSEAEKKGYGKLLMALLARDMRNHTQVVHFTIPEHIWNEKTQFFEEYGFKFTGPSNDQYRLFDEELYCTAPFLGVWKKVRESLSSLLKDIMINGIKLDYNLVMSIHPSQASAILKGKKRVEIRRRFSKKWVGSRTLIYSTGPENSFVGSFRISEVVSGKPNEIWETFGPEIGCHKEDYVSYTKDTTQIYAIIISDSIKFKEPMLRTGLCHLVDSDITAPQSYSRFNKDSVLEEAISIGSLLQSTL